MPFIHIKSLPFSPPLDRGRNVAAIARDFSEKMGIDLLHIHTTWEFYASGCYAKGDGTPEYQPEERHPLIVDLLTPDSNDRDVIARMLETLAESLSTHATFPKKNIFINHRQAHSGMVFDDGKIVRW